MDKIIPSGAEISVKLWRERALPRVVPRLQKGERALYLSSGRSPNHNEIESILAPEKLS